MARLYANENFPFPVVEGLRARGHDVTTMLESGRAGQALPDPQVLALAHAEGRAMLTLNRKHFIRLHRENPQHSGVIVCTFDPDFDAQADRIEQALAASGTLTGQLLRVTRPA